MAETNIAKEMKNCEICDGTMDPIRRFKMPGRCGHSFCTDCATIHFTKKIQKGENKRLLIFCQECEKPEFFKKYDEILLEELSKFLSSDIISEFQNVQEMHQKINHPSFLRCPNILCNHGFIKQTNITQENITKKQCPKCERLFCTECLQLWQDQHGNMACGDYLKWIKDNRITIEDQNLIEIDEESEKVSKCPKCKAIFTLIRGDCLHFDCMSCEQAYCLSCNAFLTRDAKHGLHGPHPRNCQYYLRDFDVPDLQKLLQMHGVAFKPPPPMDVQFYRDNPDDVYMSPQEKRYLEYLCELIQNNKLDPVPIMTLHNIKQELERRKFPNPEIDRGPYEDDEAFLSKCRALLQEKVPLVHK